MKLWERRRVLAQQRRGSRSLYLDVRFWNDLCDAKSGRSSEPDARDLLRELSEAVACGRVYCPIEFNVFLELTKQQLVDKRLVTAELFDQLSLKTVIVFAPERLFLEVLRAIQAAKRGVILTAPPRDEMLTRPIYCFGHIGVTQQLEGVTEEMAREIEHLANDAAWEFGFADFVREGVADLGAAESAARASDRLNAEKRKAENLLSTREHTYRAEVIGTLDGFLEQLRELAEYLAVQERPTEPRPSFSLEEVGPHMRNLVANLYFAKNLRSAIPSLHVGSQLYTEFQWDRNRNYRPNDLYDVGHAEAAIPYCNAFATDAGLASLIRQSGLATEFECSILTSRREVCAWLRASA